KMQKQGISVHILVTKLTSLLFTHDEYMSFSSYCLWLLIEYCHFIIDDVEEIVLFTKHTAFKSFVEVMAEKRQQAMRGGRSIAEEKKLLGCAIDSQRESSICLALKCDSAIDGEVDDVLRMKGVNEKNSVPVTKIQLKNGVMSMVKITKFALTGVIDKMIVIDCDISKGQSYPYTPQMMNVDASNYRYI
ncbi:MAG: hypothetical protein EZS28_011419, partial [Streblomastix strix]